MAITSLVESPDLGARRLASNMGFLINYNLPNFLYNITAPFQWPGIDSVLHPSLNNQGGRAGARRRRRNIENNTVIDYAGWTEANEIVNDLSAGVFYKHLRGLIEM